MPIKDPKKLKAYNAKRDKTAARRKARSLGVTARRKMKKKLGAAALRGKDVHHKKPLTRGGTNAMSNLAVISSRRNRQIKTKRRKKR